MSNDQLPSLKISDQRQLETQIELLKQELAEIEGLTRAFEAVLRASLSALIIEAQELHILFKAIKKAKKEKRLAQKKRGKNYKEPTGIVSSPKVKTSDVSPEEEKEKKRLYREAMLRVHPDKFSMRESEVEVATAITSRLIEIYKTESLETLRAYHAHIFAGHTNINRGMSAAGVQVLPIHLEPLEGKTEEPTKTGSAYLRLEIKKLKAQLSAAKENHLYKVKTEYADPLTFVDELREYYQDRILRLKKRTRKGL